MINSGKEPVFDMFPGFHMEKFHIFSILRFNFQ